MTITSASTPSGHLRAPRGGVNRWSCKIKQLIAQLGYEMLVKLEPSCYSENSWEQTNHKEKRHKRHSDFIPWFGQVKHLPTSTLWRPNGRGLHSTPFKWSNDPLEYHSFLPYTCFPVCEESPQVGASHPYKVDHNKSTRVREGKKHTQELQQSHAHKSRREHTNTTQGVYNSRSAQISNTMIRLRGCEV
jgi:hypothetical protein